MPGSGLRIGGCQPPPGGAIRLPRPVHASVRFLHGASKPHLMREYGLDARALIRQVETLLHTDFAISEDELAAVALGAAHSTAVA